MSEGATGKSDQKKGEIRDFTPTSAANLAVHLEPGSILFDKFKVIKLLGRGGMGSVYQVQHLHLRTEYALKCLNKQHHNDAAWRRFENEARAANMLDHPNLIKVHDSGLMADGQPYFVMDLVNGVTLADEIKKSGRLPMDLVFKLFIQVGFALAYAHEAGVIHRDIKPTNIMLLNKDDGTLSNSVKVVDFGIAKLTGQDEFCQQTLTRTGEIFGSPLYMSPEQCMGIAVDHRSDLYSLGCVMYEALTGAPPFVGDSALSTMMKHQSETPLSLKEASLGIEFPEQLELLIQKLLEKDPARRYNNASLLTADLVALERNLHTGATMALNVDQLKSRQAPRANLNYFADRRSALIFTAALISAYALGVLTGVYLPRNVEVENNKIADQKILQLKESPMLPVNIDAQGHLVIEEGDGPSSGHKRQLPVPIVEKSRFFSDNDGPVRTFHFPKNTSLGLVNSQYKPVQEYFEMQGDVTLNVPLTIKVNDVFLKYPQLISKFRPGEIEAIRFGHCELALAPLLSRALKTQPLETIGLGDSNASAADLAVLEGASKLGHLGVSRSKITVQDMLGFKRLQQLVWIDIGGLKGVKPLLKNLTRSKNLNHIGCGDCNLDLDDLKTIAGIERLTSVDLTRNRCVDDETLPLLLKARYLASFDLEGCQITAASIPTFKQFKNLQYLRLSDTQYEVGDKSIQDQYRKAFPALAIMWKYGSPAEIMKAH